MNKRSKDIIEMSQKNKLGRDETFHFHCTMCGACCVEREDILLNPLDVFKAAKELDMKPIDFIEKYCEVYIGETSRQHVVRILPVGPKRACPLLEQGKCTIHRSKPTVCGLFPLGRGLQIDRLDIDSSSSKTFYFLQDAGCGDQSEAHTVRDWLRDYNLEDQDEFFPLWSDFAMRTRDFIVKLEANVTFFVVALHASAIFSTMFVCYEMDQEFLPQFSKKVSKLYDLYSGAEELIMDYKKKGLEAGPFELKM